MSLPHYTSAAAAAELLHVSPSSISHDIERGKFKDVRRRNGHTDVAVTEVMGRLGRPLTDEEKQKVATPRRRGPRALTDIEWGVLVDPGVQRRLAETRDLDWMRHLKANGLAVRTLPPISDLAKIKLDNQNLFTRQQVEVLLSNAITQRDVAWRNWIASDLTTQAQNPNGPAPMYMRNITSLEE